MTEPLTPPSSAPTPLPPEAQLARWLAIARTMPPEQLAALVESPQARWVVITESGEVPHKVRLTAYLDRQEALPFWAFALAKSYLDDVGEWPLFGMATEQALVAWEEHQDALRSVAEILASVKPVWPDLDVVFVGEEKY
ncbi:MAG: hypothetical protein HQL80_07815 [Magnetococcales bacterium]|nr:hypothetical protein [Magnetococcales bacterium]MBF0584124.1 hypothetical protein [Magnetococcales bacterium]